MLDHTKSYLEKIHYIDTELVGHLHKLVVLPQSLCESGFSLFAVRTLPSLTTLESIDQQHFAKTKIRYISLPPNLNAIIGRPITSYYCVILKMVILRDAIKTIQNGDFVFF